MWLAGIEFTTSPLTSIYIHGMVSAVNPKRAYSMDVRGKQAADTRQHILEATQELFAAMASEFTLENVASATGTSVRTVLRVFGSKETLILEAMGSFRATLPARGELPRSVGEAVATLVDDYEVIGDRVIGMLGEEHRISGLEAVADEGRQRHREWVEASFAEQLARSSPRERDAVLMAVLAATDVYVWKLLRRDIGLDRKQAQVVIERLVSGALIDNKGE